jgi:hypothetical protein
VTGSGKHTQGASGCLPLRVTVHHTLSATTTRRFDQPK